MTDPVETNEFRVEKLDNDYATWAVMLQASLEDKELWKAMADPQPDAEIEPTAAATWAKKVRRAFRRLKMSVALHHLPTVQSCSSAKEAWDALAGVFTAKMNARRLQLTQDCSLLKIKPEETLLAYSGRAKKSQLEMAATGHPYDDNTVLIHFLNGLGDDYKTEKKLLTKHGSDMRWDEMMPMLYPVKNERSHSNTAKEGTPVGAYTAQGGTGWPQDTPMPREERRRRVVCWTCGSKGHYQRECNKGSGDRPGTGRGPSAAFRATGTPAGGKNVTPSNDALGVPSAQGTQPAASASVAGDCSGARAGAAWMIDSVATNHMHTLRGGFCTYNTEASEVTVANGFSVQSPGHGSLTLSTSIGGTVALGHALYVPGIAVNLLSVRSMAKRGKVTFEGDVCIIEQNGWVLGTGHVDTSKQYIFDGTTVESAAFPAQPSAATAGAAVAYGRAGDVAHPWHRQFGHLGLDNVAKRAKLTTGVTLKPGDVATTEGAPCVPCVQAQLTQSPHGDTTTHTCKLKKLHGDVVGPLDPSEEGVVHFMEALDDGTEMGFATPIKTKAVAGPALRVWFAHL